MTTTSEAGAMPAGSDGTPGGADGEELVAVGGLARSFGETQALVSASLTIRRGEIHALAGENGSGKTTLIKILGGVLRPDAGEIRWRGAPVRFPRPAAAQAAGVSVVFQETLVAPELSVRDNIFFGLDGVFRRRESRESEHARARSALTELGLAELELDRPLWTLSLAERQIVTIARAIVRPWELLILDEGTSALDAKQRDYLFEYLRLAKARSKSILFTSHRMDEIVELADSVSVLRLGTTVARARMSETSPDAILTHMADPETVREAALGESSARPVREEEGGDRRPVLRATGLKLRPSAAPISLEVARGEILGLAGLEGHGQLQFAETVSGLRAAATGAVEVADAGSGWAAVRRQRDARRHGIAYVPRDRKQEGLFFPLSILDNFSLAMLADLNRLGVIRRGAVRDRFRESAQRLRLTPRRSSDPVSVLSGGNQQKVLLGRWLATRPRILVLNDPLRGVDANTKLELYELFRVLAAEGVTILFVSTEILELLTLADRVAVFHRGGIHRLLTAAEASDGAIISAMFGHGEPEAPPE